jgi:flagellin-like hook-associated protein FlgL
MPDLTAEQWQDEAGRVHELLVQTRRELAEARAEIARMKRLALEATNGWACRATREIELDEISRLHQEISSLPAPPAETKEPR